MQWVAEQKKKKFALGSRITVTFSEEARSLIDYVRYARDCSTSDAIEHLLVTNQPKEPLLKEMNGLMVFAVEDDGPPITLEDIRYVEDQECVYPPKSQRPTPRRASIRISQGTIAALRGYRDAHEVSNSDALCALILANKDM
jgi:hypothetical protein